MTHAQFLAEEREHLVKFEAYWRAQAAVDPAAFPDEQAAGEWDEAYMYFTPPR